MAEINNVKAGCGGADVMAGESVTHRLDDLAKKALKVRSNTQDSATATPAGYLPAERAMLRLVMSLQGGNAQSRLVSKLGVELDTKSKESHKPSPVRAADQQVQSLTHHADSVPVPVALASKDSSGIFISSQGRHVESSKETGALQVEKNNESNQLDRPSSEADKWQDQLAARENIRPQMTHTQPLNVEHAAKDLKSGNTRMPANMLANAASDSAVNKSPANGRLTYTFSDWGKGHQVNVQMSAHNGTAVVLNPSDSLVQQRLADHSEHNHQGQPEWVFHDEQEQQQSQQQQQPNPDEEQA
ncbi:type III secretion system needle length determinant, SpaN/EivJ family [Cedecea davisae]|uniref:SpaN/EivJ family type III secretion system needle length determinant n=1 Tax=Cedecea davisae TaxID=158484 RepID=UPI002430340D|nr:type III secretion system needle length determinant, SpaN/EivJ family [Cedecea davisae]